MARKMKKGKDLLRSAVKDYVIKHDDIRSIFLNMANSGGFESRNLAEGVDILRMMIDEQNCTKFLSFVGADVYGRKGHNTRHGKEQDVRRHHHHMRRAGP